MVGNTRREKGLRRAVVKEEVRMYVLYICMYIHIILCEITRTSAR